jgi:putative SOS response-associated peptidase YedK
VARYRRRISRSAYTGAKDAAQLLDLLLPFPADVMAVYPVGSAVGSVKNDSPECIEPVATTAQGFLF